MIYKKPVFGLIVFVAAIVFSGMAVADDVNPPPWAGDPRSVVFDFWFDDDTNPSSPDICGVV